MARRSYPDPIPYRPRSEDDGTRPSLREIMCRSCAGWMDQGEDMRWRHQRDGSLACVDPETMLPYPDEAPASPAR